MPQATLEKLKKTTLENRVAVLEQKVNELSSALEKGAPPKDWRSTIGTFAGDESMKQIFEQARKIREADRKKAKRKLKTRKKAKA
ncbi:MAG: hypothetical protein ACJ8FY_19220 [Gemmataceae bacterium]